MKILVGLGNPGEKYEQNRHNVGFMAVEAIAEHYGASAWKRRFQGMAAEVEIGRERCLLLRPTTFMNESGRSVGEAIRFFKISPADVIVFHDELDLEPGRVRVKFGGGHAGHNGLKSVSAHIGNDYHRTRIGIGHPGSREAVVTYVLHDFSNKDRAWLEPLLNAIAHAAPQLLAGQDARFLNEVGRVIRPPSESVPAPRDEKRSAPDAVVMPAAAQPAFVAQALAPKPMAAAYPALKLVEPAPMAAAPAPAPALKPLMAEPMPPAKPEPVAAAPSAKPEPVAAAPAPKPQPVTAAPAPKPEPVPPAPVAKPEPVAAAPSRKPQPVTAAPAPKPEPVAAAPAPTAAPAPKPARTPIPDSAIAAASAEPAAAPIPTPSPRTRAPQPAKQQTAQPGAKKPAAKSLLAPGDRFAAKLKSWFSRR